MPSRRGCPTRQPPFRNAPSPAPTPLPTPHSPGEDARLVVLKVSPAWKVLYLIGRRLIGVFPARDRGAQVLRVIAGGDGTHPGHQGQEEGQCRSHDAQLGQSLTERTEACVASGLHLGRDLARTHWPVHTQHTLPTVFEIFGIQIREDRRQHAPLPSQLG